jgi:hypothetical protein
VLQGDPAWLCRHEEVRVARILGEGVGGHDDRLAEPACDERVQQTPLGFGQRDYTRVRGGDGGRGLSQVVFVQQGLRLWETGPEIRSQK